MDLPEKTSQYCGPLLIQQDNKKIVKKQLFGDHSGNVRGKLSFILITCHMISNRSIYSGVINHD